MTLVYFANLAPTFPNLREKTAEATFPSLMGYVELMMFGGAALIA